jgi:hypothetical protein
MDNTKEHQQLVDDILFAVGSLPNVRVWTQINGTFKTLFGERYVKCGVNGMADISGILMIECKIGINDTFVRRGIRLEIECKTGKGKLSPCQRKFKDMIEKHGGVYIQARNVAQVLTDLKTYL